MDLGVTTAFSQDTPVEHIVAASRLVDEAGLHSLWVPEHVMFFPDYASRYPYSDDGRLAGNPKGLLDPFSALTFVAAHTRRIRLGTGICLVPQRQPVYTARLVADLDYLSGGRVDFGIGIGWLKEEFTALGMDFSGRAARCTEYVQAMKALWTQEVAEFHGDSIDIAPCHFNPKPVQAPHPPILVGGESDAALRRVAAIGDGWYGFDLAPEAIGAPLARLDELLAEHDRTRADVSVFVCPNRHRITSESFAAYRDAGVDQLIAPLFGRNIDDLRRRVDKLLAVHET
ncbi:MAG: LLM class F420-dependent oxidoreductase [Pseudomonadales bacterium]